MQTTFKDILQIFVRIWFPNKMLFILWSQGDVLVAMDTLFLLLFLHVKVCLPLWGTKKKVFILDANQHRHTR